MRNASLFCLLFLLLLLAPAWTHAETLNLTSYGAVPDDGVDDAPALRAALDALAEAGGGTLVFPAGETSIFSPISRDFNGPSASVVLTGSGSTVHVAVPEGEIGIRLGNLSSVLIEKLVFRGTLAFAPWEPQFFDARQVIQFASCRQAFVRDCDFFGLAGEEYLLASYGTELSVEDSSFRGCHAGIGVVGAEDWLGLTVRRVDFIDYGTLGGVYYSKSTVFPPSWVFTGEPRPPADAETRRVINVEEARMDEGAARAIMVNAGADNVNVKGTSINVNSAETAIGIWLNGVKRAKVEQSWLGFTELDRPGIKAESCDIVELDSVKFGGGVSHVWTAGRTDWLVLRHCDIPDSSAYPQGVRNEGQTRVELIERNSGGSSQSGARRHETDAAGLNRPGARPRAGSGIKTPNVKARGRNISLESLGAIPDDGLDDAPALQAALEELASTNGGSIVFPAGQTDLLSPVSKDFLDLASFVTFTGNGATVHVSLPPGKTAIRLTNLTTVLIENLTFRGTPTNPGDLAFFDVDSLFQLSSVLRTNVRGCDFYGVAATTAVFTAFSTDLHMEDTSFQGCYGGQVLYSHDWRGLTLRRVDFLNEGTLDGVLYAKSSMAPVAWIASGIPKAMTDANSQRRVVVEDVKFEDAALIGLNVWGGAQFVTVKGLTDEVGHAPGTLGIYFNGVRRAKVEQSLFSSPWPNQPGLKVEDCDIVELEGVTFSGGVNHVWTTGGTNWLLFDHCDIPATEGFPLGVRNDGGTQVEVVAARPVSTIQFGAPSFAVQEGEQVAHITATRAGENFEAATFDFRTFDGTANTPADYGATYKAVRLAAGETSTTLSVPVSDDAVYEGTETVGLAVSNPTGGATLGAFPQAVLNIDDSSAPPKLTAGNASTLEGASGLADAVFEIQLSVPCSFPVSVVYSTVDGTANASAGDYVPANGTLTFAPGETLKQVVVSVKGDRRFEPDETFTLHLSDASPEAATIAGPDGTGTIKNDDSLPSVSLVVNTTDDEDDSRCDAAHCSLREAIADANASADANVITFNIPHNAPGYDATADAYTIGLKSSELPIVTAMTVEGSGAPRLTVRRDSSSADSRVFNVASGGSLKLSELTVAGGRADFGGALYSLGELTLKGVTLTDNRAAVRGGAVASEAGTLYVINSTVSGNSAGGDGGGLYVGGTSLAVFTNATVTANRADADADADGNGGGLAQAGAGRVTLRNTVVAGNFKGAGDVGDDIAGSLQAASAYNLVGVGSGLTGVTHGSGGNLTGTAAEPLDARLGPLADNGGSTQTHLPAADSPAIDAGNNALATDPDDSPLTTGQRGAGFERIAGGTVDIGAVEADYSVSAAAGTPQSATIGTAFPVRLRVTVKESEVARAGVVVTFNAPATGAGGTFEDGNTTAVVSSDADGVATAPIFTANMNAGEYNVTAAVGRGSISSTFKLTNTKIQGQVVVINLTQKYDGQPKPVSANTTPAGLNVVFTYNNSPTPPTLAGTYLVSANIDDPRYAGTATATLNIGKADQTITFAALPERTYGDAPFNLSATSSSGLSVGFSVVSGSAVIAGSTLTIKGAGAVTVRASQAGDANYNAASVERSFNVAQASQAININTHAPASAGFNSDFTVAASGGASANPVTYSAAGACTNAGGTFTMTSAVGTCTVTYAQAGNDNYNAAPQLTETVSAGKGTQTITFAALADRTYGDPDLALSASTTSGLAPVFKAAGSCTVAGQALHLGGAGTCTVTASQAGDTNYHAAEPVGRTFSIAKAFSTTVLTSSLNPAGTGQSVTFKAVVTSAAGTPAGAVQFRVDGASFGDPVALDAAGSAALTTSVLPSGSHTVAAEYGGAANFSPSSSAPGITQIVGNAVEFKQQLYTAVERAGSVSITVRRAGDTGAAVSVDYATDDGSIPSVAVPCSSVTGLALERCDYTRAAGTLRFAAGEAEKSFEVLLSDDSYVEGPEALRLVLSNPTGGVVLGAQSSATLQLTDDAVESAGNPSDDSEVFVRQHYHDFLNREPDASGLAFWKGEIESCGTNQQCREVKRINVSAAFFLSIEFQETGYLVERVYKTAYGDTTSPNVVGTVPFVRFNEFMADTQRIGQGVQVNVGDWQSRLEANKQAYALEFIGRERFLGAFPASMSAAEFVTKLDQNSGQVLSADEKAQLIAALGTAPGDAAKRAAALRQVAEHATLRQRELNRAFVLMEYFGYLRRDPDAAPNSDFGGWKFWLGKLEEFGGNYVRAEMVKAFINSDEYRRRFGQ